MRQHRWPRRVAKVLVLLGVLLLGDLALTYALVPYGSNSEGMWTSYRSHADDTIDSVIVGTSIGEISINPYTLDDALGSSTFDMATPSQLFADSRLAVEQAVRDHDIKRVYIAFGYFSLNEGPSISASVAFTEAKMEQEALPEAAGDFLRALVYPSFVPTPESLALVFPWTTNHVDYDSASIRANISDRRHLTVLEAADATPGSTIYEKGFLPGYSTFDPSQYAYRVEKYEPTGETFSAEVVDPLIDLVETCDELGLETYVVTPPVPLYNVLCYGSDYPLRMEAVRDAVEAAGATYIDANMLRPEVYTPADADFLDGLHLNEPGSERFSEVLADLVARHEEGEDLSDELFAYEDWDAYLASLGRIALANFTAETTSAGTTIDAYCYSGSGLEIEYQFLQRMEDGSYEELRGYQTDPSYALAAQGHGSATIRVNARQVGSTEVERYAEKTITY